MSDNYTLIEQYLNDQLGQEERAAFEVRLNNDPTFAEDFHFYKNQNKYLQLREKKASFESQLDKFGEHYFQEEKKQSAKIVPFRKKFIIPLTAAASIALLIFIWNPWQQSLYDQFSQHTTLALVEKSTDNNDNPEKAENAFNQENYSIAYQELKKYLETNPNDTNAKLAFGISALEINQIEEARSIFEHIHSGNTALKEDGTWYLALSYLKENNKEETIQYLQQIPEGAFHYKNAQELLQKMND